MSLLGYRHRLVSVGVRHLSDGRSPFGGLQRLLRQSLRPLGREARPVRALLRAFGSFIGAVSQIDRFIDLTLAGACSPQPLHQPPSRLGALASALGSLFRRPGRSRGRVRHTLRGLGGAARFSHLLLQSRHA